MKECFKKKDREDLEKETRRMSTQDGQKHRLNQWSPNFRVENPCATWSTDKAEQKLTKLYPLRSSFSFSNSFSEKVLISVNMSRHLYKTC